MWAAGQSSPTTEIDMMAIAVSWDHINAWLHNQKLVSSRNLLIYPASFIVSRYEGTCGRLSHWWLSFVSNLLRPDLEIDGKIVLAIFHKYQQTYLL